MRRFRNNGSEQERSGIELAVPDNVPEGQEGRSHIGRVLDFP